MILTDDTTLKVVSPQPVQIKIEKAEERKNIPMVGSLKRRGFCAYFPHDSGLCPALIFVSADHHRTESPPMQKATRKAVQFFNRPVGKVKST